METRKRYRCLALMLMAAAGVAGSAQAVEFDPRAQAPMLASPANIGAQASAVAARIASIRDAEPLRVVTDPALSREQFDLGWQLQLLSDERRPVAELATAGIQDEGGGVLRIDTKAHPEFRNVARSICGELPQVNWDLFGPDLVARGFRPEDVTRLRDYVAAHDPKVITRKPLVPITLSFRKLVLAYDKIRKPVPDSLVMAYLYQRAAAHADAEQVWASDVLASLDPQNSRTLVSYFQEREASSTTYLPDDRRVGIDSVLADLRRPDFDSLLKQQLERSAP